MIVHTNIEKHAIFYTIIHGPQICTINKRLVSVKLIFQHSKKTKTGLLGSTFQELLKFESGNLFGTPFRKDECFEISDF